MRLCVFGQECLTAQAVRGGRSISVCKVKQKQTSRGRLHWFQIKVLYVSVRGNDPTSPLIYYLSEQFSVEPQSLVSSVLQHSMMFSF